MAISSSTLPHRARGRLCLLLGLGLAALGVFAYVVQKLAFGALVMPWYMPALALIGIVLVAISLVEKRNIWRIVALLVVVLLTAAELGLLSMLRLPAYTGPITVGRPFPAFETSRADGVPFANGDLAGSQNNVLVFFRGRW